MGGQSTNSSSNQQNTLSFENPKNQTGAMVGLENVGINRHKIGLVGGLQNTNINQNPPAGQIGAFNHVGYQLSNHHLRTF